MEFGISPESISARYTFTLRLIKISYGNRPDHKPNLTTLAKQ
jgi:hypothetical protein